MLKNNIISLTFSPLGFSLGRTDPTSALRQNTRGFTFFRFLCDLTWLSLLALNSLVNIRTILYGFYVQKNFTEQPRIQLSKNLSLVETGYYTILKEGFLV